MTLRVTGSKTYLEGVFGEELSKRIKVRGGDTVLDTNKLDPETMNEAFDRLIAANFPAFDTKEGERIEISDLRDGSVSPEEVVVPAPMAGG